jgi:hypothetical protein
MNAKPTDSPGNGRSSRSASSPGRCCGSCGIALREPAMQGWIAKSTGLCGRCGASRLEVLYQNNAEARRWRDAWQAKVAGLVRAER